MTQARRLLFTNVALIDGTGGRCDSGWLLAEGETISAVGLHGEPLPAGPRDGGTVVKDLPGHTLLPGLIDAHVHLTADGSPDLASQMLNDTQGIAALKMANNALRTLRAGVTTVRDLGGRAHVNLQVRDALRNGMITGTSVLSAGHVICTTGGHGHFMGLESDGVDSVRHSVRTEIKAGADLVKFISTGGVLTKGADPSRYQLTFEEISVGVEEAHKAGKKTATHAQGTRGIEFAVKAGIDSIEHGYYLTPNLVEEMVKRGTYLVLTITSLTNIIGPGVDGGIPAWAVEKAKNVMESARKSHAMARECGVKIAMGTDAGTPYNLHGNNAEELEQMVKAGFSPMETIIASTSRAAELLGIDESAGSLAPGKQMDLLVVKGDPLVDISLLRRKECLKSVYKAGVRVGNSEEGETDD
jgi:imidazolonepropionase-like amidohydrolase